MGARKRTNYNLGRLLEAHRGGAAVLAWSLVVGALAGVVGGAFRSGVSHSREVLAALRALAPADGTGPLLISIVTTAILVGIALIMVRRLAPETAGSGAQEIEGALDGVRPLRWARAGRSRGGSRPGRCRQYVWPRGSH